MSEPSQSVSHRAKLQQDFFVKKRELKNVLVAELRLSETLSGLNAVIGIICFVPCLQQIYSYNDLSDIYENGDYLVFIASCFIFLNGLYQMLAFLYGLNKSMNTRSEAINLIKTSFYIHSISVFVFDLFVAFYILLSIFDKFESKSSCDIKDTSNQHQNQTMGGIESGAQFAELEEISQSVSFQRLTSTNTLILANFSMIASIALSKRIIVAHNALVMHKSKKSLLFHKASHPQTSSFGTNAPFLTVDLMDTGENENGASGIVSGGTKFIATDSANIHLRDGDAPISIDSNNHDPDSMGMIVMELTRNRNKNDIFMVFLHGYNVSSDCATKELKELDISLDGRQTGKVISLKFDWEGNNSMTEFSSAWDKAIASTQYLLAFMKIMDQRGYKNIVFIAHSLGNLVLVETLISLKRESCYNKIDSSNYQFVSFAAAVLTGTFDVAIKALNGDFKRWISYFHRHDAALTGQKMIQYFLGKMRNEEKEFEFFANPMGLAPIFLENSITKGKFECDLQFQCIDCTVLQKIEIGYLWNLMDPEIDIKNHSYFPHPAVLLDVALTVLENEAPDGIKRNLVKSFEDEKGLTGYWNKWMGSINKKKYSWQLDAFHLENAKDKLYKYKQGLQTKMKKNETKQRESRDERYKKAMEEEYNNSNTQWENLDQDEEKENLQVKEEDEIKSGKNCNNDRFNKNEVILNEEHQKDGIFFKNSLIIIVGVAAARDPIASQVAADVRGFREFCQEKLKFNENQIKSVCYEFDTINSFKMWLNKQIDRSLEIVKKCDSIIFYYSGHGTFKDMLFVSREGTVSVQDIYNWIKEPAHLNNKPSLFIIDACRGGKIAHLMENESVPNDGSVSTDLYSYTKPKEEERFMVSESNYFPLKPNTMIISANTPNFVSYTDNFDSQSKTVAGSVLTKRLINILCGSCHDLRFEMISARNSVSTYSTYDENELKSGQMLEMRETMESKVYVGQSETRKCSLKKVEALFQVKNPLVIVFGTHAKDLDAMEELIKNKLKYINVEMRNIEENGFDSEKSFVKYFIDLKEKYLGDNINNKNTLTIDGLIVVHSGLSEIENNKILIGSKRDGYDVQSIYSSLDLIYKEFDGYHCEFLRDKPKVYIINQYEHCDYSFGKSRSFEETKLYHPDQNVLILHHMFTISNLNIIKTSLFIGQLIESISDNLLDFEGLCTNKQHSDWKIKYLREMIVDVRNIVKLEQDISSRFCVEMVDTLSKPVKLVPYGYETKVEL